MSANETSFRPGTSGNPMGRPKGSRNKITLQKMMLEEELRESSKDRMPEVLNKAFELALMGDRTMLKLLLELHMSKGITDEKQAAEKVEINISTQPREVPAAAPSAAATILDEKQG